MVVSVAVRSATVTPDLDQLYGARVAAGYVGVAPSTLSRWRMLGTGPTFIRLSLRKVAYRRSALDAWLAARERTSTVEEAR